MFRGISAVFGALLIGSLLLASLSAAAQDRWAAVAADNKAQSPVVWAGGKEQAISRALAACKRISNSCSSSPAATNQLSDVFTAMCCNNPRYGCAVGVGATREDSLKKVQKVFDDAGFSSCTVPRRMSAETGKTID